MTRKVKQNVPSVLILSIILTTGIISVFFGFLFLWITEKSIIQGGIEFAKSSPFNVGALETTQTLNRIICSSNRHSHCSILIFSHDHILLASAPTAVETQISKLSNFRFQLELIWFNPPLSVEINIVPSSKLIIFWLGIGGLLAFFIVIVVAFFYLRLKKERQDKKVQLLLKEKEKEADLGKLASQVSHDIRSPLAALDVVLQDLPQLQEEKRLLIRSAIGRIRDIANALLTKGRGDKIVNNTTQTSAIIAPQLLFSLIDTMVTEKRMQFRSKLGIDIETRLEASSYGLFASLDTVEFKRVVSNLINNAVEALGEKGQVEVILSGNESQANIRICDNGKGIAPEILKRLGEKGETHGKKEGSGLGLYHAKIYLKNCGGSLTLNSELGKGTEATIVLPIVQVPDWFVSKLTLVDGETVAILDDDASIHQIWQGRLDAALRANKKQIHVMHFSTESEIYTWHETCGKSLEQIIYLVDFELLGQKTNGLEIIEKLKIQKHSILVTSRHEEPSVCEQCHRLKVRLIPKGMAYFIPIEFQAPLETPNCILIDDDELVHMTWKAAAKTAGKQFVAFTSPTEFFKRVSSFDKNTPIYVDVNLGNGISGEDVAKKICEHGFKNIFLATGYAPECYQHLSFLNDVVSKDPPW